MYKQNQGRTMCDNLFFITILLLFSSIFCLGAAGEIIKTNTLSGKVPLSTRESCHPPLNFIKEKNTGEGKDSLIILEKNGNTEICSLLEDKKFNCRQYDKINHQPFYASFVKDYLSTNKKAMQYIYFINNKGSLTECQFHVNKIDTKPDIGNCQIREDIKIPVKIISGIVLSTANKLLVMANNSEIYECGYNSENKISGCYNTGIKNIAIAHATFDPINSKVYFHSTRDDKIYSCNFTNKPYKCLPLDLHTGFPDKNIQQIAIVPDGMHILLAEKSILHYCKIDNKKMTLNSCLNVYDKFTDITSLTYSKNHDNTLYILDENMIKSCHFDDTEVHCHKIKSNNNIKFMSSNALSSATVFTFLSIKIKNKGGYELKTLYTASLKPNIEGYIRKQKYTVINHSEKLLVKSGSGLELRAIGGNAKCFIIDKPGEIHCNRSTLNMACYYNHSTQNIINGPCPLNSYKTLCSPDVIQYAKHSGNAGKSCGGWKTDYKKNIINISYCEAPGNYCPGIYYKNKVPCSFIKQAMKFNKKIKNHLGGIIME